MAVVKPVIEQEQAKALVMLRHHLHEGLKTEYMMFEDPKELWDCLNERFGHHKRDFKSITDYNSTIHEIVSILRYYDHPVTDEQMIEKTPTTSHVSNILLQEQYRERGFKKFNELMSVLLVTKQNNDLLLKNHNLRPIGSLATHEANATNSYPPEANATQRGGRGNCNGRGRGRGNYCRRGRGRGHWGRTCRTTKRLVDLYQVSVQGKGTNEEANYVNEEIAPCPSLDVSDYFMDNAEIGNDFIFGENNDV
ncbi:uncharacterized protein LOC110697897 [Chenopodium quinoa]|uniref:uncharacterized protein LOC110697897 n=1 Tax=Chenopodium quinoa TaxID=63459 RepID=UPI000B7731E7|nr:uncharacterized protein LOC110697897 [Chenopodium quinoa]